MENKKITCGNIHCKKETEFHKNDIIWAEMPEVNVVKCPKCEWYTTIVDDKGQAPRKPIYEF